MILKIKPLSISHLVLLILSDWETFSHLPSRGRNGANGKHVESNQHSGAGM
jgi:hypothetical protein